MSAKKKRRIRKPVIANPSESSQTFDADTKGDEGFVNPSTQNDPSAGSALDMDDSEDFDEESEEKEELDVISRVELLLGIEPTKADLVVASETQEEASQFSPSKMEAPIDEFTSPVYLPTVEALEQRVRAKQTTTEPTQRQGEPIDRKNLKALRDLLEVDPSADMLPETFVENYDFASMVLGEAGRNFLGIPTAPLQAGHLVLALICLIAAFAEDPGNPLTDLPPELRVFLKEGLALTYAMNTLLAVLGALQASNKGLPTLFWVSKCWLLGGIAFDEVNRAPKKTQRR